MQQTVCQQERATVQMIPALWNRWNLRVKQNQNCLRAWTPTSPSRPRRYHCAPAGARRDTARSWFSMPVFAFAVIALIALVGLLGWSYFNPQAVHDRQVAAIVDNPNVQQVALAGTKDAPRRSGIVYMVPGQSQAVCW